MAANPTHFSSKSHYWKNDLNQSIMVIKREFFFNENPREIATKAFYYPSSDLLKTREFYEHILVDTSLVKTKHNPNKYSSLELAFSTCHIFKILIVEQWGGNSNFSREFSKPSKPRFFNYWDYQRA